MYPTAMSLIAALEQLRASETKRAMSSLLAVWTQTRHPRVAAEPLDDLNSVSVRVEEVDPLKSAELIGELRERMRQSDCVLSHPLDAGIS